jgi:hypothetical protein
VRPPLIPLSDESMEALRADLDTLGLLEKVSA